MVFDRELSDVTEFSASPPILPSLADLSLPMGKPPTFADTAKPNVCGSVLSMLGCRPSPAVPACLEVSIIGSEPNQSDDGLYKPRPSECNTSHPRGHKRRREVPCPKCHKIFTRSADVSRHIATVHENQRGFPCRFCGKSFKQTSHLRSHELSRHRAKPESTSGASKQGSSASSATVSTNECP
eukprot:Plantae.Rhodophyta-Rhodochaete_pulchella.ctg52478.p1 GENE.Plantae.Rhodophyta-Rhodochaete_pulchella.ctg52478~~Plantae.Rhodophyta-Rhodochaete_pulchella.ctg52478.p1  ORF type:complete len:183 (+),score=10.20 Plantae.Rhodophyta-Rhodochaete_pulchella.ctg52478:262-810(+)